MIKLTQLINELVISKPNRIWDFNKYIPNFDPKNIQIGDKIKFKNDVINVDEIQRYNEMDIYAGALFFNDKRRKGGYNEHQLNRINNRNNFGK